MSRIRCFVPGCTNKVSSQLHTSFSDYKKLITVRVGVASCWNHWSVPIEDINDLVISSVHVLFPEVLPSYMWVEHDGGKI